MSTPPRAVFLGTALAATLALTACGAGATEGAAVGAGEIAAPQGEGGAAETDGAGAGDPAGGASVPLSVVAAFYPLEFLATRVGGDRVEVTGLTPAGAEPHDLELSPQLLVGLGESDLVVALGEFQPAVDEALTGVQTPVVDLAGIADRPYGETEGAHAEEGEEHTEEEEQAEEGEEHTEEEGEEHGSTDPHFWLDPTHMVEAADAIAEALGEVDPEGADVYVANAAALADELSAVDDEAEAAFASCEVDILVTAHDAFGYFGDRYGFEIRSINGLSPDQEPDAGTLAEISDFVADSDVRTVYTETLVSSEVADTVAAEAGVQTAVLDPVEGLTDTSAGADYLEVMRANIDTVKAGQACT